MTARAEVHGHAGAAPASVGQDVDRAPRSAARLNYAYVDDDDDDIPERYSDWPEAHWRRPVHGNDMEETMSSPRLYPVPSVTAADAAYRWPPTANEPLSVISGRSTGNVQPHYGQVTGAVHVADVHLNDTSV